VLQAGGPGTPLGQAALNTLCARYWYPIYAFIRRKGNDADKALDLTQNYFHQLLKKGALTKADPEKGRFRSFLRTDCSHFLLDQRRRERAGIRYPGRPILSIDAVAAEGRYRSEPAIGETPEKIFERNWARTLLARVLTLLKEEYERRGNAVRFDQLKVVLSENPRSIPYAKLASRLGTTAEAVATAVYRLRQRYKEILRLEIAATVADPADVEDEIRALFRALAS
jgi:RNA polymerase sigma-70 factor (ECF subfamily)